MLGIDANEINNVFASRHFIVFKIGDGSEHPFLLLQMTLGQPNSDFTAAPSPPPTPSNDYF